jgi:hypothetical protein
MPFTDGLRLIARNVPDNDAQACLVGISGGAGRSGLGGRREVKRDELPRVEGERGFLAGLAQGLAGGGVTQRAADGEAEPGGGFRLVAGVDDREVAAVRAGVDFADHDLGVGAGGGREARGARGTRR